MMDLNLIVAIACFGAAKYFWHLTTPYMTIAMVVFGTLNLMAWASGLLS